MTSRSRATMYAARRGAHCIFVAFAILLQSCFGIFLSEAFIYLFEGPVEASFVFVPIHSRIQLHRHHLASTSGIISMPFSKKYLSASFVVGPLAPSKDNLSTYIFHVVLVKLIFKGCQIENIHILG